MKEISKALLSVQKALDPVHKGKSGYGYKYADLPAVMNACLDGLNNAGIVVVQAPMPSDKQVAVIHTRLIHAESGEEITGTIEIPFEADNKQKMSSAQAYGSAMTYGRRYALVSMVGIVVDDDDGASAGRKSDSKTKNQPEPSDADLARHKANSEKADKTVIKALEALTPMDAFQRAEWAMNNPKAVEALKWVNENFPEKMTQLIELGVEV